VAGLDGGGGAEGDDGGFLAKGGAELDDAFADAGEDLGAQGAQGLHRIRGDDRGDKFQAVARLGPRGKLKRQSCGGFLLE